jgi:hypothetical protein
MAKDEEKLASLLRESKELTERLRRLQEQIDEHFKHGKAVKSDAPTPPPDEPRK